MNRSFVPQTALATALLGFGLALTGCQPAADKTAETTTGATADGSGISHAELVADHQKMEADHRIMQTADSVMEQDHRQALANAKQASIENTPAFQALEKRHDALIQQHQDVIARHDAVIKRHAELEANHGSGQVSDAQMQQDHAQMKAEDQQIQQEHKKLVDDHASMMAEHQQLLAAAKK